MHTSGQRGNLSQAERTWSAVIGTALSLLVLRRSSPALRSLTAAAGLGLLARAIAGHCAVKAAMTGQASVGQDLRDQWRRMSGRPTDSFDAQEDVEEHGDPAAVQEGLSVSETLASGSATAHR
jgi:uncharacterized membrane protein